MHPRSYDHRARVHKIAVPNEVHIGMDTGVPDRPSYSTISVCADDPYLDQRALVSAIEQLQRSYSRAAHENRLYKSMRSEPVMYADEARNMPPDVWQNYYNMMRPVERPAKKRHLCSAPDCKPTQEEFYKGKLEYLRERHPDKVREALGECPRLMCAIDRVEKSL